MSTLEKVFFQKYYFNTVMWKVSPKANQNVNEIEI